MTNKRTKPTASNIQPSPAQVKLVAAVRSFRKQNGFSPSYEDLMAELAVSKTVVVDRVRKLCEREYLTRVSGRNRSIVVTPKGSILLRNAKPQSALVP